MYYIKLFDLDSEYNNYIQLEDALLPNVSLVQEITKLYYNPIIGDIDYTQQYLTFEAVTSGKFGFIKSLCNNVQYSLDNGSTWVNMDFDADITRLGSLSESDLAWTPTVEAGQKIIWKATYTYVEEPSVPGIGLFYSTGDYNISGNILSMVFGDNFTTGNIDDVNTTYLLYATFGLVNYQVLHNDATQGTFNTIPGPVDCSNLVLLPKHNNGFEYYMAFQCCGKMTAAPKLPVTELVAGDYMYMFAGCESLTTAPVLPATILTPDCYHGMFSACKNLNNVTMLATDISAENCLIQMLPEVSPTGTFIKAPGIEIPTATEDNNYTGIPEGWTVEDAA